MSAIVRLCVIALNNYFCGWLATSNPTYRTHHIPARFRLPHYITPSSDARENLLAPCRFGERSWKNDVCALRRGHVSQLNKCGRSSIISVQNFFQQSLSHSRYRLFLIALLKAAKLRPPQLANSRLKCLPETRQSRTSSKSTSMLTYATPFSRLPSPVFPGYGIRMTKRSTAPNSALPSLRSSTGKSFCRLERNFRSCAFVSSF